ncbi:MAG TPA: YCF48-related protein, partial [Candidatus Binatia bacterium]|nr:YCF48-related protein [Candidatus Binatia bacterium]
NRYVAVGDRGDVLVSGDGKEWTQMAVPVRAALTAVTFSDPQNGWAVGHDAAIVHTKDGGKTWELQNFEPALEKPFMDVLFLDGQHGFAVGAYGLLRETADAGASWHDVDAPAIRGEELHFNGITKLTSGDLFIAGEQGMLGLSTDQGKTWKKLASPYDSTFFGALPFGPKGALVYGLRGNVYMNPDVRAGKWQKVDTGTVASMFGGTVLADGQFALVGLNGVVLLVNPQGGVKMLQAAAGTPLSGALPFGDGLLVVGESGVQSVVLK